MNAPLSPRVLRLAARLDDLVSEEARKQQEKLVRARSEAIAHAEKVDAEIMRACQAVGDASDAIAQARFAGAAELPSRRKLEHAAKHLAAVMRKHGRGPA